MSERITDARLRELSAAMPDRMGGTLVDTLLLRELAAEILAARTDDARTLAAEAAARGAAFREREAANEAAMLRARLASAREELASVRSMHTAARFALNEIAQTLGIDRASAPQRVADEAAQLVEQCNEWTWRVTDARRMTRAALTVGLAECDALRAQVDALTAEVARSAEAMRRQAAAVRTLDAGRAERDAYEQRTLRSLAGVARAALLAELDEARRERDDWNARATALESERDALTARVVDAEGEAARRTTEVVAIGAALGFAMPATAQECVTEARRLWDVAMSARAYLAADLDVTDAYDEVARTDALRVLTDALETAGEGTQATPRPPACVPIGGTVRSGYLLGCADGACGPDGAPLSGEGRRLTSAGPVAARATGRCERSGR